MLNCTSQGRHSGQFEARAHDLGTSLHIKMFMRVSRTTVKKKSFIFWTDKLRFDLNTDIKLESQSFYRKHYLY